MSKLTIQEQINNLETILKQQELSKEDREILLKEIERLKKRVIKNAD